LLNRRLANFKPNVKDKAKEKDKEKEKDKVKANNRYNHKDIYGVLLVVILVFSDTIKRSFRTP
jgi:hypothetical protein|tara:strand:+ start:1842 stop:2030 length:189 start_codon:yes stop_codon:yes gene_type:complete